MYHISTKTRKEQKYECDERSLGNERLKRKTGERELNKSNNECSENTESLS